MDSNNLKVCQALSLCIGAIANCESAGNTEWLARHKLAAVRLVREFLPSGSGFDTGTRLDLEASRVDALVFDTEFHHMDEFGGYDGWTAHAVRVTPGFNAPTITVSGRNRNAIKDYITDVFAAALDAEVSQDAYARAYVP